MFVPNYFWGFLYRLFLLVRSELGDGPQGPPRYNPCTIHVKEAECSSTSLNACEGLPRAMDGPQGCHQGWHPVAHHMSGHAIWMLFTLEKKKKNFLTISENLFESQNHVNYFLKKN